MVTKAGTYESWSEGFDSIVSELRRARKLKYPVSLAFTVTFSGEAPKGAGTYSGSPSKSVAKGTQVQLFRDHGIGLRTLEQKVAAAGGLRPALRQYVEARTGVSGWGDISKIEMHLFRTP